MTHGFLERLTGFAVMSEMIHFCYPIVLNLRQILVMWIVFLSTDLWQSLTFAM